LTAPDELYLSCGLSSDRGRESVIAWNLCYSGPMSQADRILERLRSVGTPIFDSVSAMDYVRLQRSTDLSDPRAIGSYTKTGFIPEITPAMIDAIVDGLVEDPGRSTSMGFQHGGGAIGRVAPGATAFPHRYTNYTALLLVDWPVRDDPSRHIEWLRQYWATIEPHTQGFYTNDVVDETQQQVDENYLDNYPRLLALKKQYDPTNLFRLNANIVPG
jgi:hypothetical protein